MEEPIFSEEDEVKVGYLNCNGVVDADHHEYLNNDRNLQSLDILVLAETKLTNQVPDKKLEKYLYNFRIQVREDSPEGLKNMGIMVLVPSKSKYGKTGAIEIVQTVGDGDYQSVSFKVDNILVTCMYIKPTRATKEKIHYLVQNNVIEKSDILMGDFNLNPIISDDMRRIEQLCREKLVMRLIEGTTRGHNQVDHILVQKHLNERVFSTAFYNFVSDHRSVVVRIGGEGNVLSDATTQKITHRDG